MENTQQNTKQNIQLDITRTYPVAPEKVWRAWTDSQALTQWFGPASPADVTAAEFDLRVGGRYRIAFNGPDGEAHDVSGIYEVVEPHRKLVFTWQWKTMPDRESRVSIELTPQAGGTQLHFVHDRFADTGGRDNHAKGWPLFFDQLGNFLQKEKA